MWSREIPLEEMKPKEIANHLTMILCLMQVEGEVLHLVL